MSDKRAIVTQGAETAFIGRELSELRKDASETPKAEGHTYLLGASVGVTVNPDGTIKIELYLEDVSEGIRNEAGVQYGDEDSVAALTMEQVEDDAVTFEQTLDAARGKRADGLTNSAELLAWKQDRITISWS